MTPAGHWQIRSRTLDLASGPRIMGILNVTPDSFSDGGCYGEPAAAVERGIQLAEDGADILDVGGESTRPGATPVHESEELRRVVPVVRALAARLAIPISIDTSKAQVAEAALDEGAEIVNDITAGLADPRMAQVVSHSGAGVCLMHMQGTPQTMQDRPHYQDVVREVTTFLEARRDAMLACGVARGRICLDPGIGFGKTHEHNLTLLRHIDALHELGCPLLVGHSRKALLGHLMSDKQRDRTAAMIGLALALAAHQVQVLRVHDVLPLRDALSGFQVLNPWPGR